MKAYRQDFIAIATLVTGGDPARLAVTDITKDTMRTAFAAYARDHEAASIRRCWSTWNVLCTFLYTGELLAANPMQFVGRPKLAKPLPKALPRTAVEALLEAVAHDHDSKRQTDWAERDLALILTALLAGLRAEELRQADVGDIRTTDDGAAVIHVKGKGGKDRSVPIEAELLSVIEAYLDSRAIRFPGATKRKADVAGSALSRWPARSPLFVGRDGERITRGTLQSRIKRAFKRAGPDAQPVPGALVHGLRHTYATELASSEVSVYTLMKLLGHPPNRRHPPNDQLPRRSPRRRPHRNIPNAAPPARDQDKVHIEPTHDHDASKHLHTTTQSDDLGPGDDVDARGARRRDQRRLRWQRHHVEHRARWRSLARRRPARSPPVAVDPTTPRRYGAAPGRQSPPTSREVPAPRAATARGP